MPHDAEAEGAGDALVFECELTERPEKVWRALTVPGLVAEWLLPSPSLEEMRPETGCRFTLEAKPEDGGAIACEVLEAEPPRLLRYSWRGSRDDASGRTLDSVVTFVLNETVTGGTHLRIIHGGLQADRALPLTSVAGGTLACQQAPRPRRDRRRLHGRVPLGRRGSVPVRLAA